jgi:hypothetical protein
MLWDWNWFRQRTAEAIVPRVLERACGGDIVVMHDGDESAPFADQRYTVEATARLIPDCARRDSFSGRFAEDLSSAAESAYSQAAP